MELGLFGEEACDSPPAAYADMLVQTTELLIGFWLFESNREKLWSYEEDHLARMTETLEESFTPSLLDRCANRDKFFKTDG